MNPSDPATTDEMTGLAGRLLREPFAFDFFQAVRLLQKLAPERAEVGHGGAPWSEAVRFRSHVSLSFPPSAIHDLIGPQDELPIPVLTQTFFGLIGPSGVLPRHYTEMLLRLAKDERGPDRFALRDWLDLFNHRFVSLFYRAWEKYRSPLTFEKAGAHGGEADPFSLALASFVGLGTPSLRHRLEVATREGEGNRRVLARVEDLAVLYYAGFFAHKPRNATSLEALLKDYFGLPVAVEQFRGQWLGLEPSERTSLGDVGGNNRLGVDAVAGERVWDCGSKFRLRIGPLSYARFLDLLPDRSAVPERKTLFLLCHLARLYVGPEMDFEVQLVLAAAEIPESRLAGGGEPLGSRLGWNSWVRSLGPGSDAEDAVFDGEELDWAGTEPGPDSPADTEPGRDGWRGWPDGPGARR